jgi:hypothetical protein
MSINDVDRKRFLGEDFYNALRYLFEGAIRMGRLETSRTQRY